jgi:predicted Zn-dependent protease
MADSANAGVPALQFSAQLASELKLAKAPLYSARAAALKSDPNAKAMTAADAAIRAGDWKKADELYAQLLTRGESATNIILLNNAANARLELGDVATAVSLARKAQAAAANDPVVLDTLAWALFKQDGASPEVISLVERAMQELPNDPDVRRHYAIIAGARGKTA